MTATCSRPRSRSCALAGAAERHQGQLRAVIEKLHKGKRILYDRGCARGFCLWPHTSVDLEKTYEDARRAIDTPQRVADLIKDSLETRPIVARRHYIETGNLRHYDVRYCSVSELPTLLDTSTSAADGIIVVPLCETMEERKVAVEFVRCPAVMDRRNCLIAVTATSEQSCKPHARSPAVGMGIHEHPRAQCRQVCPRGGLSAKAAARSHLDRRIQSYIGFKQLSGQMTLEWFHRGRALEVMNGRQLLEELSRIFDETYPMAPRISNELVNRRNLSSAAAAARMRLIERMFTNGNSEWLGMSPDKKPPEMSMYLSVLRDTGLHRKQGDLWRIGEPHHKRMRSATCPGPAADSRNRSEATGQSCEYRRVV